MRRAVTDLSTLFPHPLPCIAIEQWTSVTGWPEYRIILLGEERRGLCLADDHAVAVSAANAFAERLRLPVADLSGDDY